MRTKKSVVKYRLEQQKQRCDGTGNNETILYYYYTCQFYILVSTLLLLSKTNSLTLNPPTLANTENNKSPTAIITNNQNSINTPLSISSISSSFLLHYCLSSMNGQNHFINI